MISVKDYPCEIWVNVFEFLLEADLRRLSTTCRYFNEIANSFFKNTLLPYHIDKVGTILDKNVIYFSKITKFFEPKLNYFEITGTNPRVLVNLNETLTFDIEFDYYIYDTLSGTYKRTLKNFISKRFKYPKLKSFKPYCIKIINTIDCKLKFTHKHDNVYYVDGCSLEEIHSASQRPCSECYFKEYLDHCSEKLLKMAKTDFRQNYSLFPIPSVTETISPVSRRLIIDRLFRAPSVRISLMGKRCDVPLVSDSKMITSIPQFVRSNGTSTIKPHPNQQKLAKLRDEIKSNNRYEMKHLRNMNQMNKSKLLVCKQSQRNQILPNASSASSVSKFNKNHR